ncbi:hypothetical protein, partial [Salmonella sp. SAL4458]|uniref:hypothetical protein n=1 Tax=Salmonella sp. SAL4458 TaxID=3159913 RepID=UPI003978CD83
RYIGDESQQVRHVALVLNISDAVLATALENVGIRADLGRTPLDIVVRSHFCLLTPDGEHASKVRDGAREGFFVHPY